MSITLTYNGTTVELPDAMNWSNEYSWSPVEQSAEYSTSGAILIDVALKLAGRPIILEGDQDCTWCTRELCDTLQSWVVLPGIELTLVIRGISHKVIFDHQAGGLRGFPVIFYEDSSIESDDWYVPTLKFLEI